MVREISSGGHVQLAHPRQKSARAARNGTAVVASSRRDIQPSAPNNLHASVKDRGSMPRSRSRDRRRRAPGRPSASTTSGMRAGVRHLFRECGGELGEAAVDDRGHEQVEIGLKIDVRTERLCLDAQVKGDDADSKPHCSKCAGGCGGHRRASLWASL